MRDISGTLKNAGLAPVIEPIAKVEVVDHPFMTNSPLAFTAFADRADEAPRDAVELDNGNVIICHETDGYTVIASPETDSQWEAVWTAWPVTGKPANFEFLAIGTDGTNAHAFARDTAQNDRVSVSLYNGSTWGNWTLVTGLTGTVTEIVGCAEYNALFMRRKLSTGTIQLAAVTYYNAGWNVSVLDTGLYDPSPANSRIGVVEDGDSHVVFFSANNVVRSVSNVGVMKIKFCKGTWGQIDQAIFFEAQERMHHDHIRSISTLGDRKAMVVDTVRTLVLASAIKQIVADNFASYENNWWMPMAMFEPSETRSADGNGYSWGAYDKRVEGDECGRAIGPTTSQQWVYNPMDLSSNGKFTEDDFVCLYIYCDAPINTPDVIILIFIDDGWFRYGYDPYGWGDLPAGASFLFPKKSDAYISAGANWATIRYVSHTADHLTTSYIDCCRCERADPDDAAKPNATGRSWDFQPNTARWTITNDVTGFDASLACIDCSSGEKSAMYMAQEIKTEFFLLTSVIQAKLEAGEVGVWFNLSDMTAASEDGYAFILDTVGNTAKLWKYAAGARTEKASYSITIDPDINYYVAISKNYDNIVCFVSATEANLYDMAVANYTDPSPLTGGSIGFVCLDTLGRFNDLRVYAYDDTDYMESKTLAFMSDHHIGELITYDSDQPRDVLVGRYAFDIDDSAGIIYRSNKDLDANAIVLSDDVLGVSLSYADESSSSAAIDIFNADARYSNHPYVKRGAGLRVSMGYKTTAGDEYANMGLFRINTIDENYSEEGLDMSLSTLDANWLLKNWKAQHVHVFKSQNRLALDFTQEATAAYLVNTETDFKWEWESSEMRTTGDGVAYAITGEKFYGVLVEGVFRAVGTGNDVYGGIIFASDDDAQNLYLVRCNWASNVIQLYKKVAGSYTQKGSNHAYTLLHGTYTWLRVLHTNNKIFAWRSIDGVNWTHMSELDYTDTDHPWLYGHVGIRGDGSATNELGCGALKVYALYHDPTADDAMRHFATKAGILDFESEYQLYDTFSGVAVDTDIWRTGEETLTSGISGGRMSLVDAAATWGYLNSQLNVVDCVVDFSMDIPSGAVGGVLYRMDSAFANGYRIAITPGAVSTCRVILSKIVAGVATELSDFYPRVAITADVEYDYRLSVDGKYVSLWLGECLLFTATDDTFTGTGYFGVGVFGDVTIYVDDVKSKYADPIVDWLTVNVGDSAETVCRGIGTMSRSRYYIEEDAKMKIGSMVPVSGEGDCFGLGTEIDFEDQLFTATVSEDDEKWVTHLRVVGKDGVAIDYFDLSDSGLDTLGYRFDVISVASVSNIDELQAIAEYEVADRKRAVVQRSMEGQLQVATQRGDRIGLKIYRIPAYNNPPHDYIVDGDYIVKSMEVSLVKEEDEVGATMTLEVEDA